MEKSDIPQKQILEEIMKHTHRIIRLLTLAVVSCALAALLSGCTKEEFIAGYNEFLFGDWFPSPPSAGETTAAEGSASGDSRSRLRRAQPRVRRQDLVADERAVLAGVLCTVGCQQCHPERKG